MAGLFAPRCRSRASLRIRKIPPSSMFPTISSLKSWRSRKCRPSRRTKPSSDFVARCVEGLIGSDGIRADKALVFCLTRFLARTGSGPASSAGFRAKTRWPLEKARAQIQAVGQQQHEHEQAREAKQ